MIRRVRYIGESPMPLSDTYPYGVMFVGRKFPSDPAIVDGIDGTAFLVWVEGKVGQAYVVTAAHLVEDDARYFVRMPVTSGSKVRDLDVPRWYPHPDPLRDVAVAPIELPKDHAMTATGLDQFIDDEAWLEHEYGAFVPELGVDVYFVGLLTNVDAMVEDNIPMVRSGTLGRMYQDGCPVRLRKDEETVRYITAHLIDCRSFGGFSGSPCYVQQERAGIVESDRGRTAVSTKYRTALLGLIGGHYDDWIEIETTHGKSPHLSSKVNTGVGYVVPAEYIRETINREDLIDMRERREKSVKGDREKRQAATQDSVRRNESEYERFEDLAKQLVSTPKPEKD